MTTAFAVPPLLEASQLGFARQDERVFGPLNFCLHPGEWAMIEGDNGSGKTTLLRILAGLLQAGSGELRWRGEPLQADRCLGERLLVGHQFGLKAELSVDENLRATMGLHGCRGGIDIDAALREVGLAGYGGELIRRLSTGEKKRAALARLLLIPASLWLLDEPYANLDRHGIALVNRLLAAHTQCGGVALLTSHGTANFHANAPVSIRMHG